jgi:hypothetical protein
MHVDLATDTPAAPAAVPGAAVVKAPGTAANPSTSNSVPAPANQGWSDLRASGYGAAPAIAVSPSKSAASAPASASDNGWGEFRSILLQGSGVGERPVKRQRRERDGE